MPRKPKPRCDDSEESERFIALAKEVKADLSGETFERSFPAIARTKPAKAEKIRAKKKRF